MSGHLHVLSQSCPNLGDLKKLSVSTVASDRYRTARIARVATELSIVLDIPQAGGSKHLNTGRHALFIGKPPMRSPETLEKWEDVAHTFFSAGCRVILDYTDHHLGLPEETLEHFFYSRVWPFVSIFTVPSRAMRKVLLSLGVSADKIKVIPDPFEFQVRQPIHRRASPPVGLWFGHPNNAHHLWSWLNSEVAREHVKKLVLVTSAEYLRSMNFTPAKWNVFEELGNIQIFPVAWSFDVIPKVVRGVDYGLVLSGSSDPTKVGISSNRLVTSLCLGLPTIASLVDSYMDFESFFIDANNATQVRDFFGNFDDQFERPAQFQEIHADEFSLHSIDAHWRSLLNETLPSP